MIVIFIMIIVLAKCLGSHCHWSITVSLENSRMRAVDFILTYHSCGFTTICANANDWTTNKDPNLLFWFSIPSSGSSLFTCTDFYAYKYDAKKSRVYTQFRFPRKPYCHFNLLFVSSHYNCTKTNSPHLCHCRFYMMRYAHRTHSHTLAHIMRYPNVRRPLIDLLFLLRASPLNVSVWCSWCRLYTVSLSWTIKWLLDFVCETNVFETMGTYLLKGWTSGEYSYALDVSFMHYTTIPYFHFSCPLARSVRTQRQQCSSEPHQFN